MCSTKLFPSASLERITILEESLQNKKRLIKTVLIPVLLILKKLEPTLRRKIVCQKKICQNKLNHSY